MKLFALLIFVGFAAASLPTGKLEWQPGHKYEFKYSGRVLTGLPALSNQFSGLAINATVSLYVKDPQTFMLNLEEPRYVAVNQELKPQEGRPYDEGNNWRRLRLPEMNSLPSQASEALKTPIFFKLGQHGGVEEVKVHNSDPLWSINFKKALVSLFQTKLQTGELENMIQTPGIEELPYWSVKEQTILGECETTYQVNKMPEHVIRDEPSIKPRPRACQGQEYFEIVRTINFDKCDRLSSYRFFSTGEFTKCSSDSVSNCNNLFGRSTTIRYLACGSSSSGKLSVQTIINDGEMNTLLHGHQGETVVTGTRQNLTLVEVQPVSSYPTPGQLPTDLLYDLTKVHRPIKSNFIDSSVGRIPKEFQTSEALSKVHPMNHFSGPSDEGQIGERVIELLKEVAKNIHGVSGPRLSESQIGMKLLTVGRGLAMIKSSQEIQNLYKKLQPNEKIEQTMRQLFLDSTGMYGTPQSIEFFRKAYKEGEIKDADMTHFFVWLPHRVMTPSKQILEELFELISSETIKRKPTMYNAAITGFTQLVEQACVSPDRRMQYPTWVYGEFCSPMSPIVQEKLIPYLSRESRSSGTPETHKHIHIIALGLLSHKNVIGELTPLVEKAQDQDASLRRVLGIYSLAKVGRTHPNLVVPIFQALFTNPTESTEIRIIAFNTLLKLNPPTHVFNTIAHATRQEPSMNYELLKTINIALYTLGHSLKSTHLPIEQIQLMKKSKEAYAIVKKTYGIAPSSGTYYKTEFMKELGVGYQGFVNWVSSQESVLPKNLFVKLNILMETMNIEGVEMGYRLSGVDSLYEQVSDALNGHSESQPIMQKIREGLSSEWKSVIEKLQLKNREPSKFNAALYLRAFGSGVYLKSITESTSEFIKEELVKMIRDPSPSDLEKSVNFQKSFDMNSYVMIVPSEMGIPIDAEIHTPVTVSLIGKMKVETEQSKPSVQLESKLLYTSQMTGWVGTLVPFTKEFVLTGIDKHLLYNVPGSLKLNLDVPEQKVSVTIKPGYESRSGETDVMHYHVMPYTVKESIVSLVPLTKSQGMKPIRSSSPVKAGSKNFGESLGLHLKGEYKTESAYTDFRTLIETLKMYKYCPFNMVLFQHNIPAFDIKLRPSLRQQRYTLTVNPSESSTKEIQMEFKVGMASKAFGKPPHYHSLKSVSKSERLSSSAQESSPSVLSLVKKVLPYRFHSESLESVSHHSQRVENIKSTMEGLESTQSSKALSLITKIILKGNRPRIFTYNLNVAEGKQTKETKMVEQKWNIKFSSENSGSESLIPKKVCIKGQLTLPLLPMWNINDLRNSINDFHYDNKVEFGQSQCSESSIVTRGNARSSQKQKSYSLETSEHKKCQESGSPLSTVCQMARDQASALDEIEFSTEFKNIPKELRSVEQRLTGHLKALLWPYFNFKASSGSGSALPSSYKTSTLISFKQRTPSFDLIIKRPSETIVFANVHIPQPYSLFFPLKGTMTLMSAVKQVTGSGVYPTCKVDSKTVFTYDNQTVPFETDKCYHLLTADCSKYKRFGVAVRSVEGEKKEVKVYLKKTVVKLEPHGHQGPKVFVQGEPIEIRPNQEAPIHVEGKVVATVTRTVDGVIILKAPSLYLEELAFNGKLISVIPSPMLKNKLCGLCGDNNHEKNGDVAGPKKCIYSKPELKVASYRISSESCPPMPSPLQQELRRETEQCSKFHVQPTKVAQGYKINTGRCTLLRHLIMQHKGQICISKVPVTRCGPSCKTIPSELVEKSVPWACLSPGRLADYYVQKVNQGKDVQELENMPTAFETKMTQPRHCVHALVSGSRY